MSNTKPTAPYRHLYNGGLDTACNLRASAHATTDVARFVSCPDCLSIPTHYLVAGDWVIYEGHQALVLENNGVSEILYSWGRGAESRQERVRYSYFKSVSVLDPAGRVPLGAGPKLRP